MKNQDDRVHIPNRPVSVVGMQISGHLEIEIEIEIEMHTDVEAAKTMSKP